MRGVLILAGLVLIVVGFALVFIGTIAGSESGNYEAGGVIMIGPIPIVFGSNRRMAMGAMLLAFLLMVTWIAFFFLMKR